MLLRWGMVKPSGDCDGPRGSERLANPRTPGLQLGYYRIREEFNPPSPGKKNDRLSGFVFNTGPEHTIVKHDPGHSTYV